MRRASRHTSLVQRFLATLGAVALLAALAVQPAYAISFTIDDDTKEAKAVPSELNECPTLTSTPRAFEAFFNTDDMEYRGYLDANNQSPWSYANKMAQIICGAKQNATIMVGMYFIRAIGTVARPESDAEIIWRAMNYVHSKRNVTIGFVMDGGSITPASAKSNIVKRLVNSGTAKIYWCYNGCLNTNKSSTFPYAINHEKFVTISDTVWETGGGPHPAVFSSSGQFARSQVRTYWQEASLIYGDQKLYDFFVLRYQSMKVCSGSRTGSAYVRNCKGGKFVKQSGDAVLKLVKSRGIWVDSLYRHGTSSGRGTFVSFSPQPQGVDDYYTAQFNDVDCLVDSKIRVAMYRLTVTRATIFVKALASLKSRGCDVKILLSQKGGAQTVSKDVVKILKKYNATTMVRCTRVPIHTKMILITPSTSNAGRALFGTANMTTSGLRYSEEHVITIDTRRADAAVAEDMRRAIGVYQAGWNELNQGNRACK